MKYRKRVAQGAKYLFVLCVLGMIVVVFHDSIGPTVEQLKKTRVTTVWIISLLGCLNFAFEGLNLTTLARYYNPALKRRDGVACAFYAAFYRAVTLGSGAFVAASYYLNKKKVPVGGCLGLIAVQYISYKMAIAVCSGIGMLLSYDYILSLFGEYMGYIWAGYVIAVLVALGLAAGCCMTRLHRLVVRLLRRLDHGKRMEQQIDGIEKQFVMLEQGTGRFLRNPKLLGSLFFWSMLRVIVWMLIPGVVLGAAGFTGQVQTFSIATISNALAAVIPTPAGIGSTEFMFTALFSRHCGGVMALDTMLLYRFSTFIVPFLAGGAVAAVRHGQKKHRI